MPIDILFLLLLLLAIFKGLSRGLIIAVFSMLAFLVGLAAALRLSVSVAHYLEGTVHTAGKWMPMLAFLLVFVGVILIVRWSAALIEKMVDLAMLGWMNKLGGVILYAILYTTIYSVVLFYATQLGILGQDSIAASKTYHFIALWGPWAINALGEVIPFFHNMFKELEDFFGHISGQ